MIKKIIKVDKNSLNYKLREALWRAGKKVDPKLKLEEVQVEHPENEDFGDYSSNIALVLGKKFKTKPKEVAEEIKKHLKLDFAEKIEVAGPGFLNVWLKNEWLIKQMERVIKDEAKYGKAGVLAQKTIMVEYAHPNTHKLFHIGHLRNITNGEAIVRILEALVSKVIRANYQGDVGLHIAKCLWQIEQEKADLEKLKTTDQKVEFLSKAYVKGNKAYEKNKKAQGEILKINKKIYDQSDPKINKLWRETRQWSLDYFERIYKRVYSHFDRYYFEGEVAEPGKKIVLGALKKSIFKKSKGAIIFPGSKFGLHDRVFVTSEGNPTYEAKDMELGRLQFAEYNPDLIVHNIGPEQAEYLKVVFEALVQIFPKTRGKKIHIIPGWVRLKKGKMASRLGNIVTAEWLLDEAKKRIKKAFPKVGDRVAEMIAVGAVKYSFLKVHPPTEIAFDFNESISLEGNSGPYLQYTYARCRSVINKSARLPTSKVGVRANYRLNSEELAVLRALYKFPEAVAEAGEKMAPNLICGHLFDLAQRYNAFYNKHRILPSPFRLNLTRAIAQILRNGLYLLGIEAPKKM